MIVHGQEALYIRNGSNGAPPYTFQFVILSYIFHSPKPIISKRGGMALVSAGPLVSKSFLPKSSTSSTYELRMRRRAKPVKPFIGMSLTNSLSDDGREAQRRVGDYHSNLWEDAFIQPLSSPYGAASYRERAERLITEVKDIFSSISTEHGNLMSPFDDLLQRLWMVDNVERLGISRHFKNEIKAAVEYVYSFWSEKGIGPGRNSVVPDLNSTAMGFQILRLHGYSVSPDVLEVFEKQFGCSPSTADGEIRSILNLYRASLIAFPEEKIMEKAEICSTRYLKETLQKLPNSGLTQDIEDVLEYGWHTNLPRLEARNYIEVFGQDSISPWRNENTLRISEKLLELAKLEFNIFHSIQQEELQFISRWWKDSGLAQLTFARHRPVEYYTLASCISTEPKHSAFRLGFVKLSHIGTVLDDMYDTYGTMDELELFTEAIKRWNPSAIERLPPYMKGLYMVVYETVTEMAKEAEKVQGRDTLNYIRNAWDAYLDSYMQEAKWISSGYLPTFEEYLENGKVSFGFRIVTLQPILTILEGPPLHHILQGVDFPSRFNDLICSLLRLKGDTRCYKADKARGEEASCISSYMKDNPGLTEADALNHINALINDTMKELNWELLRPDSNIPISFKKYSFDIARGFHHLYKYRDGFSVAQKETKNLVMRTVVESVPL